MSDDTVMNEAPPPDNEQANDVADEEVNDLADEEVNEAEDHDDGFSEVSDETNGGDEALMNVDNAEPPVRNVVNNVGNNQNDDPFGHLERIRAMREVLRNSQRPEEDTRQIEVEDQSHVRNDDLDPNDRPHVIRRGYVPLPFLDDSITMSRFFRALNVVTLAELEDEDADDNDDLDLSYIDAELIRIISAERNNGTVHNYSRGRLGNSQNFQSSFQRIFLFRATHPHEANLLFYMLQSTTVNDHLWHRNLELRDNGEITVGVCCRIFSPLPIERHMAGDIPMVETRMPCAVLRNGPVGFDPVPIDKSISGHNHRAFVLPNAQLTLRRITPEATCCSGLFCDRQRVSDWMNTARGCGCYQMVTRRSSLVLVHSIKVVSTATVLSMKKFSSLRFSSLYLSNIIGPSVKVNSIAGKDHHIDIRTAARSVIDLVNQNGGFTVTGWYKRGVINDRTMLDGTTNRNTNTAANRGSTNENLQVDNGDVNYHITKIIPTNPDFADLTSALGQELLGKKFDVSSLYINSY